MLVIKVGNFIIRQAATIPKLLGSSTHIVLDGEFYNGDNTSANIYHIFYNVNHKNFWLEDGTSVKTRLSKKEKAALNKMRKQILALQIKGTY